MPPLQADLFRQRMSMRGLIGDTGEDPEDKAGHECNKRLFMDFVLDTASVGVLAIAYMAISTGLITFNKYLLHETRFPFVIFIGMLHMSFSLLCNLVLFRLCPSLYPSLTDPERQVHIDQALVLQVLMPIAGCFGAQLVLSNMAFMHSSLAFLQMMKQSNVVLVYFFSLALSLESFSWKRILVLACIVAATGMTVHGELNFSLTGFAIQGVSMLCESLKLTLQSHSLSATGRKLDALTFVMLIAPLVLLVLLALLLGLHLFWPTRPEALTLPPLTALWEYRHLLLANGSLAFAMNVSHALLIKRSSATAFILTGVIMKDVVIVVVGAMLLGELLSPLQVAGFTMQLVAILVWSLLKAAPMLAVGSPAACATKAAGGWQLLRRDPGPASPEAAKRGSSAEWGPGPEAAATLLEAADRQPDSPPSSKGSFSTEPPPNDEESGHCTEDDLKLGAL
mmetsp:Transcript_116372/g.324268  ORF Transcript_116372/g.324268 Transcript_116372/m.324268 type:complete len:452 (-) Transcript_116372:205-1560(-)